MNARVTLSRNKKHKEGIAIDPETDLTGKFHVRVMMRDLPLDAVIVSATLLLDGSEVETIKNPKVLDWLSEEEIERNNEQLPEGVAPEGPSGIIEFTKIIDSKGTHEVAAEIEFSDNDREGVAHYISPPPPEPKPADHAAVALLKELGAKKATINTVDRMLAGGSADLDEVEEALVDIGSVSERDLGLLDIQTLAAIATGMRDGVRQVAVARDALRKAVNTNG